jgi:enoyl-CoA hydratase/carnithine racemase
MMVEGQTLPVDDALVLGLIHKVWETPDHESFMRKIMDYAHSLTPPEKATLAVGAIKRAVHSGADMSLDQALALERELQSELFRSEDAKEGIVAYTQKRKAAFKGR